MTSKIELSQKITSIRSLSITVLLFGVFYGIKLGAFSYHILKGSITDEYYIRALASVFFGLTFSKAIRDVVFNLNTSQERVSIVLAVIDFFLVCSILKILEGALELIVYKIVFAMFMSFVGYWLHKVFNQRVKQGNATLKQDYAMLVQQCAVLKPKHTTLKQQCAEAEQLLITTKQDVAVLKQYLQDVTCGKCGKQFSTKSAKTRHEKDCTIQNNNTDEG